MGLGELTFDGFLDTDPLIGVMLETVLCKIRIKAPQVFSVGGSPAVFQTMVSNGQLKTPSA